MYATFNGCENATRELVQSGADIEAKNEVLF